MGVSDYIILVVLALLVVGVLYSLRRGKKKKSSGCSECFGCSCSCGDTCNKPETNQCEGEKEKEK